MCVHVRMLGNSNEHYKDSVGSNIQIIPSGAILQVVNYILELILPSNVFLFLDQSSIYAYKYFV